MLSKQALMLDTVKQEAPDEIIRIIRSLANDLAESSSLEVKLHAFMESIRLHTNLECRQLVFAVLLSFVLGDIAGQGSPFIRDAYIEKIQLICDAESLDYADILHLSAYQTRLTDLIMQVCMSD